VDACTFRVEESRNQFLSGNGRWIWDILLLEHVWST